jgi:hypothetical protein
VITTKQHGVHGYAVVRRLDWKIVYPESVVAQRTPSVALSSDQIAVKYRGFDGDLWPGDEFDVVPKNEFGLVESTDVDRLRSTLARVDPSAMLDLIFIADATAWTPEASMLGSALGYDFGHFASIFNKYSVLLNEVIFGAHDQLRAFGSQLNEHLLFPSLQTALFLGAARRNLVNLGADLETDTNCTSFVILGALRDARQRHRLQ